MQMARRASIAVVGA